MYELSDLKAKKLSELQEIAKKIGLSKIGNLKNCLLYTSDAADE